RKAWPNGWTYSPGSSRWRPGGGFRAGRNRPRPRNPRNAANLELHRVVLLADARVDALLHEDAVPDHERQHRPQAAGVIRAGTGVHRRAVLLEHRQHLGLVEDVIRLGILDVLLRPAVELIAGQPVADRHREAQLLAVEHVLRNDALHRLTQRVLRRPVGDLHVDREGLRDVENDLVQERHAQLQGVGHRDLVRLDQDVPAQPGEQVQVLHAGHRIHVLGLRVDRRGDLAVVPLRADLAQHALQLLVVEGAGVTVVALLHGHRAALQQRLTAYALRQSVAQLRQHLINRARNLLERGEAQRLLIYGVATEEFVRTLAGEQDLHVLAGLGCHEVQRHQSRVGDRVVQV